MYTAKVSTKGWIVIPKDLRKKYGLKKGTRVQVVDYGGVLALIPLPDDPAEALHGMLEQSPSLTGDLLEERVWDRSREKGRSEQALRVR
jgi:AbrB family looped-hinge helix DNA binding protein